MNDSKLNERNLEAFLAMIINEWEKDSIINPVCLVTAELDGGRLHSKYINYKSSAKRNMHKLEHMYNIMRGKKSKYYRGKMTKTELDLNKWEPFQYHLKTKTEVDEVMAYDLNLNDIVELIAITNNTIDTLDNIIYMIRQRNFQIRNIIEIKKFEAGI